MTHSRISIAVAVAVAVSLTTGVERSADAAPTKQECFAASQSAQELERTGKLGDARTKFLVCASASCPALVRVDCAQHVEDVNRAMPTLVLEAKDGDGSDLVAVKVTLDGAPLLERLDGRPIEIDPGEHKLSFAVAGRAPIEKSFVIREGERGRHERIVFVPPAPPVAPAPVPVAAPAPSPSVSPPLAPPPPTPPPPTQADASPPGRTQRFASYALAGAGVIGIGVGSAFGLMASSSYNQARTDCGTGCGPTSKAQSEKSSADGDATVSTVAFIAGGAALVAGVVLFFTAPKGVEGKAAISLVPSAGPSSAGLLLSGKF